MSSTLVVYLPLLAFTLLRSTVEGGVAIPLTPRHHWARRFLEADNLPKLSESSVIGQLGYVDTHDGKGRYVFIDAAGILRPFKVNFIPPTFDQNLQAIAVGSIVIVGCGVGDQRSCSLCPDGDGDLCVCPIEDDDT
ncbi:hypothetical protein Vretifemale_16338, partial [Volvox reticuliferus]